MSNSEGQTKRSWRGALLAGTVLVLAGGASGAARAQEISLPDPAEDSAVQPRLPSLLKAEAQRYVVDGGSLFLAPLHWDASSWTQAAIAVASLALLTQEDSRINSTFQQHRSAQTNSFSAAVTPLGSYAGVGVSFASLGAGLLLKNSQLRDTGRDAVEAELFAAGIVTPVLKGLVGRFRPNQGGDGDENRLLSGGQSFPSGHSTEAFAVASVFAARSRGWVVPAIVYTLASGVALARMNDRTHYASDVVAGAIIGTAIGHSIVHRHLPEDEKPLSWSLAPVTSRRGAGIGVRLEVGGF